MYLHDDVDGNNRIGRVRNFIAGEVLISRTNMDYAGIGYP